jgi:hypothetical protein
MSRLRPRPGVDPIKALRAALKVLGPRFGLQAIEIRQASVHRCASGAARLPLWLIAKSLRYQLDS